MNSEKQTKQCNNCLKVKLLIEFHTDIRTKDGKFYCCKVCFEDKRFETRHGITREEYNKLVSKQEGRCMICSRIPRGNNFRSNKLHVDHCHKTNKIRGLICSQCNRAIGLLQDSPELLIKAAEYILDSTK